MARCTRLRRWWVPYGFATGSRAVVANCAGARRPYESPPGMARRAFYSGVSAAEWKPSLGMVEAAKGELLRACRHHRSRNDDEKHD